MKQYVGLDVSRRKQPYVSWTKLGRRCSRARLPQILARWRRLSVNETRTLKDRVRDRCDGKLAVARVEAHRPA